MRQIRADHYRPALVEFANLNFLVATGGLQKNELRPATRALTPNLFEAENISVERNSFLQVVHAIARMQ